MAIVLQISRSDNPDNVQEILVNGKMVMGQSIYCDVKLDDKLVANMQREIRTAKSGHIVVTNLDLKREVYINKARLKKSGLKVSDVLIIGPFEIKINSEKLTEKELEVLSMKYIEYC